VFREGDNDNVIGVECKQYLFWDLTSARGS
jgi:hypothetical protein